MPVQRFRRADEMPPPTRVDAADLLQRIRTLWNRAQLLAPPAHPRRGVARFKSIEQANAQRAADTIDRMRRSADAG